ncbi:serine/threonine-protein kinase PknH/PknJ [Mycobacterium hubeiense]|uniref:serine/threonine-protein kinase PknH/PknJ n=1 Tax=Mycobacterium hubeiense TaxID=1867256 RepID=UPI000C7F4F9D|nr:serine/threonine-protein kinase PknH/PknJ [Mycobacterium sp. QGD 101]
MLSAGSVIAGYRVEGVLGAGGMGSVYLVANPVLPRREALKVLSAELSRDNDFRARFMREADVAASLVHPNIVEIYSRGETDDGQLWITMQYVEGTDADDALRAGAISPARAVFIVAEVAKALDYAHQQNVIHRDVKPANFLLSSEGGVERVLLGDFGIARALDDVGLTVTGSVLATVPYAAPEVLSGMPIDGRADLYSLGCSLFRLLTGRTPFGDDVPVPAMMMAHLQQPPPRVTQYVPQLSQAWDQVIATAMAKDPVHRFQSAGDLAAAAAAALEGRAIPVVMPPPSTNAAPTVMPTPPTQLGWSPSATQPKPVRRRRGRWIAAGAAAALVAVGTTATLAMQPDSSPTATSTTTTSAPPVPVSDLESLMLTTEQVSVIMGVGMNPEQVSTNMGGDAQYMPDKECAGPWAPGQRLVYAGSGWVSVAQQPLSAPGTGQPPLPYQAFQAIVGFPSADLADRFRASQMGTWERCANRTVQYESPGSPGLVSIIFGAFSTTDDGTLTMTQILEGAQGWLCGRALGVRNNVAIDTLACSPDDAVGQAVRLVNEIAAKISG